MNIYPEPIAVPVGGDRDSKEIFNHIRSLITPKVSRSYREQIQCDRWWFIVHVDPMMFAGWIGVVKAGFHQSGYSVPDQCNLIMMPGRPQPRIIGSDCVNTLTP